MVTSLVKEPYRRLTVYRVECCSTLTLKGAMYSAILGPTDQISLAYVAEKTLSLDGVRFSASMHLSLGMRKTTVLILLCVVASLYAWTVPPATVSNDLAFSLDNLLEGRVWTLVTAIFVHANLLHLVGNMIFLYVFGNTLEGVSGSGRMLIAFFTGGILSFLLSLPFFPAGTTFVGASAAIFTLTAVVMLVKPLRFSFLLLMPVGLVAILYFLYNALSVYYQLQSDVAYVSHVIGFMLGLPFGIAWSPQWKRNLLISVGLLVAYFVVLFLITTYLLPALR